MIEGVPLTMVPIGHMCLLFDPSDPGYHLSIFTRAKEDDWRNVVSWDGTARTTDYAWTHLGANTESTSKFSCILLDQTHADALIMASMHGVVGERWFMLVERLTGIRFSENFGPRIQITPENFGHD